MDDSFCSQKSFNLKSVYYWLRTFQSSTVKRRRTLGAKTKAKKTKNYTVLAFKLRVRLGYSLININGIANIIHYHKLTYLSYNRTMQRFLFCLFSFAGVTFRLNFRSLIPPRLFSKRLLDILSIVSRFQEEVGQAISEFSNF